LQLFGEGVSKHGREIRVMNVISLLANLRTVNTANSGIYEVYANLLKPYVHHSQILHPAHTVYLRVLYGSQNKQRLLPSVTFAGWFL
jgi:hypothetical protein